MKHITQDMARKYIALQLEEHRIIEIDRHLSSCDVCAERVRALRLIADDFDAIWDSWTAKSHAQAQMQARIAGALSQLAAKEKSSELKTRIDALRDKIQLKSEAALKIILDASKKTARIISESAQDALAPGIGLKPAYSPVRTRGAVRTLSSTRETHPPIREAIEIVSIVSVWKFILNKDLFLELNARESCARITIVDIEKACQLAVLDPISRDLSPISGFFERENDRLVVEINDVHSGKYSLYLL